MSRSLRLERDESSGGKKFCSVEFDQSKGTVVQKSGAVGRRPAKQFVFKCDRADLAAAIMRSVKSDKTSNHNYSVISEDPSSDQSDSDGAADDSDTDRKSSAPSAPKRAASSWSASTILSSTTGPLSSSAASAPAASSSSSSSSSKVKRSADTSPPSSPPKAAAAKKRKAADGSSSSSSSSSSGARRVYLECTEGTSYKFYEIITSGKLMQTKFGRIGSGGHIDQKEFDTKASAKAECEKLIREKTRKGYVLIDDGPHDGDMLNDMSAPATSSSSGSKRNKASKSAASEEDDSEEDEKSITPTSKEFDVLVMRAASLLKNASALKSASAYRARTERLVGDLELLAAEYASTHSK